MYTAKQMIVMRRDLHMRKGKIAAQAGGVSALQVEGGVIQVSGDSSLSQWFRQGEAKVCVYVDSEEALLTLHRQAREAGITSVLIQASGLTEFHGQPTYTCLALEPLSADRVDPITGQLPLF